MMKFLVLIFSCLLLNLTYLNAQSVQSKDTVLNKTDAKGNKQGYWKKIDNEGVLIYEGRFINNIPVDTFKYYYPNKSIKAVLFYYNKGRNATFKMFYQNHKLMCQGYFSHINDPHINKKDSAWKYYDHYGILISDENYKNNKKDGISRTYYPNGNVDELVTWKDGVKNGPWKQYYEDGKIKLDAAYKNNLYSGPFCSYFQSGVACVSGIYRNGLKQGQWIYYTETMKIIKKEYYEDGKLVKPRKTPQL